VKILQDRSMDKVHYFFLHGFNDFSHGENSTDKVVKHFTNLGVPESNCHEFDYEHLLLLGVHFKTDSLAKKLAKDIARIGKPAVVVCHSHGNVIAHLAAKKYGANIVYHVAINPALDVKTKFADTVHQIDTYFTPGDKVVTLGKIWSYNPVSVLMKRNWWGEAGRYGFKPEVPPRADVPPVNSHTGVFRDRNLRFWGPVIAERTLRVVAELMKSAPKTRRHAFAKALTKQLVFALSEGYDIELEGMEAVKISLSKHGRSVPDDQLIEFITRWRDSGGATENKVYTLRQEKLVA